MLTVGLRTSASANGKPVSSHLCDYTYVPQIRSVSPEEAAELVKKDGYVILDVRPEGDFKEVMSC